MAMYNVASDRRKPLRTWTVVLGQGAVLERKRSAVRAALPARRR